MVHVTIPTPISTIITSTMRMILRESRLENDWNEFAITGCKGIKKSAKRKKIRPIFCPYETKFATGA